jgi:hypothetical protein
MAHTVSVPVNVGSITKKTMKTAGQMTKDAKGQNIIVMPAEEKTH